MNTVKIMFFCWNKRTKTCFTMKLLQILTFLLLTWPVTVKRDRDCYLRDRTILGAHGPYGNCLFKAVFNCYIWEARQNGFKPFRLHSAVMECQEISNQGRVSKKWCTKRRQFCKRVHFSYLTLGYNFFPCAFKLPNHKESLLKIQ